MSGLSCDFLRVVTSDAYFLVTLFVTPIVEGSYHGGMELSLCYYSMIHTVILVTCWKWNMVYSILCD